MYVLDKSALYFPDGCVDDDLPFSVYALCPDDK